MNDFAEVVLTSGKCLSSDTLYKPTKDGGIAPCQIFIMKFANEIYHVERHLGATKMYKIYTQ